mmetsp:Transcript_26638/g.60802  ORF Transcript_26638/g.60802 Transcript_26638/m.60802 type:complete len:310 (+) Transcript_26638:207-1136(+)
MVLRQVVVPDEFLGNRIRVLSVVVTQLEGDSLINFNVKDSVICSSVHHDLPPIAAPTSWTIDNHSDLVPFALSRVPRVGISLFVYTNDLGGTVFGARRFQGFHPRQLTHLHSSNFLSRDSLRGQRSVVGSKNVSVCKSGSIAREQTSDSICTSCTYVSIWKGTHRPDRSRVRQSSNAVAVTPDLASFVFRRRYNVSRREDCQRVHKALMSIQHHQAVSTQSPQSNRAIVPSRCKPDSRKMSQGTDAVRVPSVSMFTHVSFPAFDGLVCRPCENGSILEAYCCPNRLLMTVEHRYATSRLEIPDACSLVP